MTRQLALSAPSGRLLHSLASLAGAAAHEVRPAYLEVREETPGVFSVLLKTPCRANARWLCRPHFRARSRSSRRSSRARRERHGADLADPRRRAAGGPDGVDRRPADHDDRRAGPHRVPRRQCLGREADAGLRRRRRSRPAQSAGGRSRPPISSAASSTSCSASTICSSSRR